MQSPTFVPKLDERASVLIKLINKKCALQDKMYKLRYDDSMEDSDKELDLKQLSYEITELEQRIIEQIKTSIDDFIQSLDLDTISAGSIFEERKKTVGSSVLRKAKSTVSPRSQSSMSGPFSPSPSSSSRRSTGGSAVGGFPSDETPFYKPSPKLESAPSRRHGHLLRSLNNLISADTDQNESELSVIEQEIATLRATLISLESKKNPSKTILRQIDDLKEQLKLKLARKEKLIREQISNENKTTTTTTTTTGEEREGQISPKAKEKEREDEKDGLVERPLGLWNCMPPSLRYNFSDDASSGDVGGILITQQQQTTTAEQNKNPSYFLWTEYI